jgi:aerobic carbon-monoxide dehydrogenase medium subunit
MSVLPSFAHARPSTVDEALELVSYDDAPYCGGTELLLAMREGLLRPTTLVDLKRIPEFSRVTAEAGQLVIGGAVTHQRAIDHPDAASVPELTAVLGRVGNPRVRASGTLAGNLCFGEPKSDVATMLIALGADVELVSARGRRRLSVDEFALGPYTTAREDDELLSAIFVPIGVPAVYEKYQTMERPTVGVAAARHGTSIRVVVGAVGGRPESFDAEGDGPDPSEVAAAVEVIADLTGSEPYKRHVTELYVRRALQALREST